jgi:hypothetical protein
MTANTILSVNGASMKYCVSKKGLKSSNPTVKICYYFLQTYKLIPYSTLLNSNSQF